MNSETAIGPSSFVLRPSDRLRVLYFIGSYGPDVMGNASHEQTVRAMRERGHDVEVLTQINEPGVPLYTHVEYSGVPVYRVNVAARNMRLAGLARRISGRLLKYDYLPTLLAAYRKQIRRRYDLVHVEGAYPFGFVAALASGDTPFLANVQGADVIDLPEHDYGYRRYRLPSLAVAFALRRASLIRVISPMLRDYLVKERLAQPNRMVVVLRAIEDAAFPPVNVPLDRLRTDSRLWLAHKYGLGLGRPVVMSLSRLHPFKGLEYLVDAMPLVNAEQRKRGAALPWLLICGPSRSTENFGDYRKFLLKKAEAAGVASQVLFTGQIAHPEVRQHLAGADILAIPSIIDAQNKVLPEAAAVGTPSVVTETTGIASYFAPHDACVLVPPRSSQAIADAIIRLLNEHALHERIGANAVKVASTLSPDAVTPQLEDVWRRAASNGETRQ